MVRDAWLAKVDTQLFFKSRTLGAIAPMLQVQSFALDGMPLTQLNYGLAAVTRPGFVDRYDLFFVQLLFHAGNALGGQDNSASYGSHALFGPFTFLLAYRVVLDLDVLFR